MTYLSQVNRSDHLRFGTLKLCTVDDDNTAEIELLLKAPDDLVLLGWRDSDEDFDMELAGVALISVWRGMCKDGMCVE